MDKIIKFLLDWKICLPIFIVLAVFLYLAPMAFRMAEFYGGFDFSPYDEGSSDHLIAVIHK